MYEREARYIRERKKERDILVTNDIYGRTERNFERERYNYACEGVARWEKMTVQWWFISKKSEL